MARTGYFGRQPRSQPSLTSTLVALAREWQNQRAENIMSAWEKGGQFEGKKATDAVVLKFWRDRRAGVARDDPYYDLYDNAVTQLDYNIHESKMTAKYATKKATDAQMVSFYLGWAKKVPKDSEFYRVLQRDAGQYMRTSKANNQAEANRRKEAAYQRQQSETQKLRERPGEYAIDVLRNLAQAGNAEHGIAPAISAPGSGSDLTDFDPTDPNRIMKLLEVLNAPDVTDAGSGGGGLGREGQSRADRVLYHDTDNNPVTTASVIRALRGMDPGFKPGQKFDINYVTDLMDRKMQGLNERIARANKTGHVTDAASLQKEKLYASTLRREVASIPVQQQYMEARSDFDAVVADKSSTPAAIYSAWQSYASTLKHLADSPNIAANDNLKARLVAEANMETGAPSLYEDFTGLSSGGFSGQSDDIAKNKAGIERTVQQLDAVNSGAAVWAYGETDGNGVFVPKAGGREIGAATPDSVASGGIMPQTMTVLDPRGGQPLQVMVTAIPIFATATDPVTGKPYDATNPNPIGYAFDVPEGSQMKTHYGFQTKQGFRFSDDPPWDNSFKLIASSKGGQNHLEVDLTGMIEQDVYGGRDPVTGQLRNPNGVDLSQNTTEQPNGLQVVGATPPNPRTGAKGSPGQLVFNPQTSTWSTDTRSVVGTPDPQTDFTSLTLSNLVNTTDGQNVLANLDKYPAFQQQLQDDVNTYGGVERDPRTGAWVPGTGNQARLSEANMAVSIATRATDPFERLEAARATWGRVATGSAFQPTGMDANRQKDPFATGYNDKSKLATDQLAGTGFAALGNQFIAGTNNLRRPNQGEGPTMAIKPVTALKVPTMPDVKVVTTTTNTTNNTVPGTTTPVHDNWGAPTPVVTPTTQTPGSGITPPKWYGGGPGGS